MGSVNRENLREIVNRIVDETPIIDVHTHLYSANFNELLLWGVDDLLTYHYLIAETFRYSDISYEKFWSLSKREQADLIWKTLFLESSPYSEACRGVLTVLNKLGLDVSNRQLESYRDYFNNFTVSEYIDKVFNASGVKQVVMTNDPFDDLERPVWEKGFERDDRFLAALRIDPLLNTWEQVWQRLRGWGYEVSEKMNDVTLSEVRRFLKYWAEKMDAKYMAVSLPPTFRFPEESNRAVLIEKCVLPVCKELNIPFAMMIGVKRQINPSLRLAGESMGKSDIDTIEYLCSHFPENKFMVTMLARENQHELAVVARKFRNLLIFGCWWFLNNPSLIEEITRIRFELLGSSIIPQHSDARILDQLIYKWSHSRRIIADVLYDKYDDLLQTGWITTEDEIKRDVKKLFGGAFIEFVDKKLV